MTKKRCEGSVKYWHLLVVVLVLLSGSLVWGGVAYWTGNPGYGYVPPVNIPDDGKVYGGDGRAYGYGCDLLTPEKGETDTIYFYGDVVRVSKPTMFCSNHASYEVTS